MAVVTTPANAIVLTIGTDSIECQVTAHDLADADQSAATTMRTGCGDVVNIPADTTEVGSLTLTLLPERGVDGFVAWTWLHAGETVAFVIKVNVGEATALEWAGSLTVSAINEKQDEYTKIETVDVTWNVTEWTSRAVAVTP